MGKGRARDQHRPFAGKIFEPKGFQLQARAAINVMLASSLSIYPSIMMVDRLEMEVVSGKTGIQLRKIGMPRSAILEICPMCVREMSLVIAAIRDDNLEATFSMTPIESVCNPGRFLMGLERYTIKKCLLRRVSPW